MSGRPEMAALLLARGADPDQRDEEGVSAAHVARLGDATLLAALGCSS